MHLGGAGIGEADRHIIGQQHVAQHIGTIHAIFLPFAVRSNSGKGA
jgi:hypothetical protein